MAENRNQNRSARTSAESENTSIETAGEEAPEAVTAVPPTRTAPMSDAGVEHKVGNTLHVPKTAPPPSSPHEEERTVPTEAVDSALGNRGDRLITDKYQAPNPNKFPDGNPDPRPRNPYVNDPEPTWPLNLPGRPAWEAPGGNVPNLTGRHQSEAAPSTAESDELQDPRPARDMSRMPRER